MFYKQFNNTNKKPFHNNSNIDTSFRSNRFHQNQIVRDTSYHQLRPSLPLLYHSHRDSSKNKFYSNKTSRNFNENQTLYIIKNKDQQFNQMEIKTLYDKETTSVKWNNVIFNKKKIEQVLFEHEIKKKNRKLKFQNIFLKNMKKIEKMKRNNSKSSGIEYQDNKSIILSISVINHPKPKKKKMPFDQLILHNKLLQSQFSKIINNES